VDSDADIVIQARGLAKHYRIGRAPRHDTLRDAVADRARRLWRSLTPARGSDASSGSEDFWALQDVSFSIRRGEVVGIVGRNGAGKSTLLKVLARITEPTRGSVSIRGRVASLLEVGTGFHPELTGRENIYLNGAVLGMPRAEIRRKFDEIVAFSEVERFLDTPVKRYSSGMYVRLAFSVAAHLEPDILIVDEVLAVGDLQFQQKCLGKMREATLNQGRTVLIVSHQMESILRLCDSALLLSGGRVEFAGSPTEAVARYTQVGGRSPRTVDCRTHERPAWAGGRVTIRSLEHLDTASPAWSVPFGGSLDFVCELAGTNPETPCEVFHAWFSPAGLEVAAVQSPAFSFASGRAGVRVRSHLQNIRLTPGAYTLNVGVRAGGRMEDFIETVVRIDVLPTAESITRHAEAYRAFYVPEADFRVE
jgi:lipopolysaccharide transport system ATP-binding protein